MIYAIGRRRPPDAQRADVEGGARPLRARRRGHPAARALGLRHRRPLRLSDGHGVGEGRRDRRAVHRPGAPGDRAVAPRRDGAASPIAIKRKGRRLVTGLEHRRCGRHRPRLPDRETHATSTASSTARSWSPATTDPDWVPIMKRAAAIVTDHGGRTSHAAIVSRELGLPAIVGTGNATEVLHDGQDVTVSCAEGDEGFVYEGTADFESTRARSRRAAGDPHQGDAQPRQSGGGVPLVAPARPTASGSRAWSSSSATTSRSIRWRWCATTRSRTRTPRPRSPR